MRFTMILEGHAGFLGNVKRLQRAVIREGATDAWNGAQHLFARTRAVVPYEYGDLYNAAYMVKIGEKEEFPMWAVGYASTGYEVYVHEIPAAHPTRGPSSEPKQDHFLSEPRDQMVKTYPKTVADGMQKAISRTTFRKSTRRRTR